MINANKHIVKKKKNTIKGFDEVVRKLWTIINSSKTDEKEKMKAINLIMQCYREICNNKIRA